MIIITAAWKAKPGKEVELSRQLKEMVSQVKKNEPKCLQYTLHQGLDDKSRFYFYERYTDASAVDLHKNTPHFKKLMDQTKDLIEEPVQVGLYEVIE